MTEREKMIATAYTGVMFVNDFGDFARFVQDEFGMPCTEVMFLLRENYQNDLKKKVRPLFLEMVKQ